MEKGGRDRDPSHDDEDPPYEFGRRCVTRAKRNGSKAAHGESIVWVMRDEGMPRISEYGGAAAMKCGSLAMRRGGVAEPRGHGGEGGEPGQSAVEAARWGRR